jgi:hypothetical protein
MGVVTLTVIVRLNYYMVLPELVLPYSTAMFQFNLLKPSGNFTYDQV